MLARNAGIARHASCSRRRAMCSSSVRLAVVGDVHGLWDARDAAALKALTTSCGTDFAVFVGDFGNEAVPLVREIASLDVPKAAILGNHDAWYTMTARARSRSRSPSLSAAAEQQPDRVSAQLQALGPAHVGFGHMAIPVPPSATPISLVGARPFSKGGKSLRSMREFMARFGIVDMKDSVARILDVIHQQVPVGAMLLLLGHNGPAGLGDERHNICGVDWQKEAGDHGDPDLAAVLAQLQQEQRPPALVLFGHMHHTLQGGGNREMVFGDEQTGTLFLNAATVPRVVTHHMKVGAGGATRPGSKHHFLLVDLAADGQVAAAADVWVLVQQQQQHAEDGAPAANNGNGTSSSGQQRQELHKLLSQPPLRAGEWLVQVCHVHDVFRTLEHHADGSRRVELWNAHAGAWQEKVLPGVPRQPHPAAAAAALQQSTVAAAAAAVGQ